MTRLEVRVTPRADENALDGFTVDGVLRIRVTAAPADGSANEAVVRLLAKALNVPARDVTLLRGSRSRHKIFDIALEPRELEARARQAVSEG